MATFVSSAPSVTGSGGSQSTVVTYQLAAPTGGWTSTQDGSYTIVLLPNQVRDMAGNYATSNVIGTLNVDLTPPTAAASYSNAGSVYTISVVYSDASAIDVSTLDSNDIEVIGTSFDKLATFVSATPSSNASSVTATYTITLPNSTNAYSVNLVAGQVKDTFINSAAAGAMGTIHTQGTATPGSITGTVFFDSNNNGTFDTRELRSAA